MTPTIIISFLLFSLSMPSIITASPTDPIPTPWPVQFHSILIFRSNGTHYRKTDLWYDWPNGRNFNIIQYQLGKLVYDVEWTNGTSFYYTLDSDKICNVMHFSVGILTPDWLDGAHYLGQRYIDKFLCNVWEKVDFITYYEDVVSKRPVFWAFYDGMTTDVMTFEVGKVLEDPNWQAPVYCFNKAEEETEKVEEDKQQSVVALDYVANSVVHHHRSFKRPLPLVMNL